jgi:hypothetical protein
MTAGSQAGLKSTDPAAACGAPTLFHSVGNVVGVRSTFNCFLAYEDG